MTITVKQKRFCEEYITDLNATQAAKRAGYSEDTAKSQGQRLLTNVDIQRYVQTLMDERSRRTQITADNVLREIARLGFSDIRKIFTDCGSLLSPKEIDDDTAAALQSIEVVTRNSGAVDSDGRPIPEYVHKLKLSDKGQNLERLGKHLKLFVDRVEHDHDGEIRVKWMS